MKTQKVSKANMGYILFISAVAAIGGILFGYDTAVISGTTGIVSAQFGLDEIQQGDRKSVGRERVYLEV